MVEVGVDVNTGRSLMSELELELKWSGGWDVSWGSQVGIKIDIWTEEVQSKLLVWILEICGRVQLNRSNWKYIKLCIYRC